MYIPELEKIQRALFLRDCRDDFYKFRLAINHGFVEGWFPKIICEELQRFYHDIKAGKKPKVVVTDKLKSYIQGVEDAYGADTKHRQGGPFHFKETGE